MWPALELYLQVLSFAGIVYLFMKFQRWSGGDKRNKRDKYFYDSDWDVWSDAD